VTDTHPLDSSPVCLPSCNQAGDASAEELKTAAQLTGKLMPIKKEASAVEYVTITKEMKVRLGSPCLGFSPVHTSCALRRYMIALPCSKHRCNLCPLRYADQICWVFGLLQEGGAYAKLRLERMNARMAGKRKKRAEEKAKEEKDALK